jgi:8-amino-7-oxononanoate synthase
MKNIKEVLSRLRGMGLYPKFLPIETTSTDPEITINGEKYYMFCSNNYLGLATHPKVIAGAEKALRKHGTGPGGSRLLCGNIDLLMEVDRKLAAFVGKEDAITFPTGYMANLTPFKAILDPFLFNLPCSPGTGVVFADKYNHASLVDGCSMTSAKIVRFRHNDISHLERKLSQIPVETRKIIVVDGVYSMDGETAPLREISDLSKKYEAFLMVDEAHAVGVLGPKGCGISALKGTTSKTDIIMGACDKALGATGGFLAGDKDLIDYFRGASRPYMFSSAMPAVMAGGILAALEVIQSEEGDALREKLYRNADYLRKGLSRIGARFFGEKEIAVVPLVVGEESLAVQAAKDLMERGIFCSPVMAPAVPSGTARIRLTPMATHTKEHIDYLLNAVNDIYTKLKIEKIS